MVSGSYYGMRIALAICLLLLLATTVACDPGHTVTFENRTSHTVTVFRGGARDFVLKPSEKAGYTILEFAGSMAFEARNESGKVIYSETLTWEELKAQDWRIVITQELLSPTPTEGR
jgi:hypothetical protein